MRVQVRKPEMKVNKMRIIKMKMMKTHKIMIRTIRKMNNRANLTQMISKRNNRHQSWSHLLSHNAVEIVVVLFLIVFNVKMEATINVISVCKDLVRISETPSVMLIEQLRGKFLGCSPL
jgi:hypothetical protein